ncbi:hypothetical protein U91I_00146 [alpha proteobacterium U9-1i]|nr:hypothetical protein U91I_00146 [alpha proteobacterium U9-1i]
MVIETPSGAKLSANVEEQARRLALALDAIESALEKIGPGAEPSAVVAALTGPVSAFDTAAKGA